MPTSLPTAARDDYTGKLRTLLDQGVDCFKTDFGEHIPTDAVRHDGSDPERMHNYYTHLHNQAAFDLLRAERGEGEALLFARSATADGQQYPVHWGGDCESHFTPWPRRCAEAPPAARVAARSVDTPFSSSGNRGFRTVA